MNIQERYLHSYWHLCKFNKEIIIQVQRVKYKKIEKEKHTKINSQPFPNIGAFYETFTLLAIRGGE